MSFTGNSLDMGCVLTHPDLSKFKALTLLAANCNLPNLLIPRAEQDIKRITLIATALTRRKHT